MSVRITRRTEGERTILQVAGRLHSPGVALLQEENRSVEESLLLDLSQLISANTVGIKELRELVSRGAELEGASPFVQLLLDEKGSTR
jgi:hypothetical protein